MAAFNTTKGHLVRRAEGIRKDIVQFYSNEDVPKEFSAVLYFGYEVVTTPLGVKMPMSRACVKSKSGEVEYYPIGTCFKLKKNGEEYSAELATGRFEKVEGQVYEYTKPVWAEKLNCEELGIGVPYIIMLTNTDGKKKLINPDSAEMNEYELCDEQGRSSYCSMKFFFSTD